MMLVITLAVVELHNLFRRIKVAQFSIEIADQDLNRVLNAIGSNYKRPEKVSNPSFDAEQPEDSETNPSQIDNPETLAQFANRIVRQFLAENVKAFEIREAKKLAADQALQNSEPNISDPQIT